MKRKALVIDDDLSSLDLMEHFLSDKGFDVLVADSGSKARRAAEDGTFDLVITDLNLPDANGVELISEFKKTIPDAEIIMATGFGSVEKAIEATKAGAFYYVDKPVNLEKLNVLVEKAVERNEQAREIRELRSRLASRSSYEGIIGGNRSMQDIYEVIESVADSDANILILGESGTGKEVIANAIHYKSLRAKKSFIKVNCSALPKDLIESQLFGHTRGSFTGAVSDKVGFIGQASGGSLLLDEIGEMPIELQPKLLRVLQERVYYRVGSDKPQEVDFRLICSTNREPNDAIKEGILREDLLYRINTIEIRIPPLRERMDDIPMLAEHFLSGFADKYSKDGIEFAQSAYDQMLNYSWRGNVRELEHVIERAVLLSKNDSIEDLGIRGDGSVQWMLPFARPSFVKPFAGESVREPRESADGAIASESEDDIFERVGRLVVDNLRLSDGAGEDGARRDVFDVLESEVVLAALKRTKGNKQAAANLLGLYRPRLYGMIRRHKLDVRL